VCLLQNTVSSKFLRVLSPLYVSRGWELIYATIIGGTFAMYEDISGLQTKVVLWSGSIKLNKAHLYIYITYVYFLYIIIPYHGGHKWPERARIQLRHSAEGCGSCFTFGKSRRLYATIPLFLRLLPSQLWSSSSYSQDRLLRTGNTPPCDLAHQSMI
jgi:hypothetical protein